MTLKQRIVERLEQLTAKGPGYVDAVVQDSARSGYLVGVPAGEGDLAGASLSLENYDRYSVTLLQMDIFRSHEAVEAETIEAVLRHSAAEVTQRLTYLEEPLELVELDLTEGMAQLRSSPPYTNGGGAMATYWEILIQVAPQPQAKIARYRWQASSEGREVLAYPATFATLGRIAEDLAASLTYKDSVR
jgi:hypothetical protein